MQRQSALFAAAGLVAIAAAGTLRFVVVPAQAQLPADTDTTRTYEGTVTTLLNAEALAAGDLGNAILRDIPVQIQRATAVTSVADGNATLAETSVVTAPDGTVLLGSESTYVVDRRTMLAQDERSGLVIGWPIGTEARDYAGWSADLQSEVPLTFTGTDTRAGIDVHVFESSVTGTIVDPATLSQFPSSLPKFALPLVAGALDIPSAVAEQLPTLLQVLPDEVPLGYTLTSDTTYWVDATTGMVIDLDRTESRAVFFDVEGVPATPIADVFAWSYTGEEASVAATVADARAAGQTLTTFGTTLPIVLLVVGGLLLLLAARRGKPSEETIVLPAVEREHVGAGV